MKKDLSIVIVSYNSEKYLSSCLDSIYNQKIGFSLEVIIFDNNSADNSVELVKNKYSKAILLKSTENIGFAMANNKAVEKCTSNKIFLLNPDTKLEVGALEILFETLHKNYSERKILVPMQLGYDDKKFLNCGLGLDVFGFPINEGTDKKFFYADGAAIFMYKKDFISLGMFDEGLFMIMEDIDLSWKARLLGVSLERVKNAVIYHKSGHAIGTGGRETDGFSTTLFRRYHGEKNIIRNELKNYSLLNLIWVLPINLLINLSETTLFLLLGKRELALVYVRAYIWNIKNIRDTLKKRSWIQSRRVVGDSSIINSMYKGSARLKLLLEAGVPRVK